MKIENAENKNKGSTTLVRGSVNQETTGIMTDCFGCAKGLLLSDVMPGAKAEKLACPSCGHLHSFKPSKTWGFTQRSARK